MKKDFNYKGFVKKAFLYIIRAKEDKKKLGNIRLEIKDLLNEYPVLNKFQKSRLYEIVYKIARAVMTSQNWEKILSRRTTYDQLMSEAHKIWAEIFAKQKNKGLRATLNDRNGDVVFYKCSEHTNPAKDHKDFQGRIYVNRFWRTRVSGEKYMSVLKYIKNNKIVSVQKIMGGPVYLTTRPYCKHYFIPLETSSVLDGISEGKKVRNKNYKYYDVRDKIYQAMNKVHPCDQFEKKIKGRI